jgi:hypothetical protein
MTWNSIDAVSHEAVKAKTEARTHLNGRVLASSLMNIHLENGAV